MWAWVLKRSRISKNKYQRWAWKSTTHTWHYCSYTRSPVMRTSKTACRCFSSFLFLRQCYLNLFYLLHLFILRWYISPPSNNRFSFFFCQLCINFLVLSMYLGIQKMVWMLVWNLVLYIELLYFFRLMRRLKRKGRFIIHKEVISYFKTLLCSNLLYMQRSQDSITFWNEIFYQFHICLFYGYWTIR